MREAILTIDTDILTSESAASLLGFLPDNEDLSNAKGYSGDFDNLDAVSWSLKNTKFRRKTSKPHKISQTGQTARWLIKLNNKIAIIDNLITWIPATSYKREIIKYKY